MSLRKTDLGLPHLGWPPGAITRGPTCSPPLSGTRPTHPIRHSPSSEAALEDKSSPTDPLMQSATIPKAQAAKAVYKAQFP